MISTNRLHICIGCCDFLSEEKKRKTKTHEEITCSEKYCTKTKTDWIAHVVWPDAVRWHASNVHTHSLHIYSNATIFLTRFLFRFQLITFCRVQMLVSHSIACLEMAIVVAANAHTVSTVNTEKKTPTTIWKAFQFEEIISRTRAISLLQPILCHTCFSGRWSFCYFSNHLLNVFKLMLFSSYCLYWFQVDFTVKYSKRN